MKTIFSILHTDVFFMDCLNKVIEQCHQRTVRNTVLSKKGPNALRGEDKSQISIITEMEKSPII